MRRLSASLVALPFLLGTAVAGCSDDGGGASEAYCDTAEEAAELEGDVAVDEGLDTLDDLVDDAPADLEEPYEILQDAIEAIVDVDVDAIEDLDQDEVDEATDAINDVTQEECDVDLDLDLDLPDPDDLVEEDETGGEDTGEDTGGEDGGGSSEFDELVDACGSGDMAACDELFQVTPVGSPEEEFGATCGGIVPVEEAIPGECEAQFG